MFKNSFEKSREEIEKKQNNYKPIETKSYFDNNYMEYESKGKKIRIYCLKIILI